MLQLFFAVAFSAVPLTLYIPPIRSLNLFVETIEEAFRQTSSYAVRAYPRVRYAFSPPPPPPLLDPSSSATQLYLRWTVTGELLDISQFGARGTVRRKEERGELGMQYSSSGRKGVFGGINIIADGNPAREGSSFRKILRYKLLPSHLCLKPCSNLRVPVRIGGEKT
ncbi:hypothetical protein Cgig2_027609 [Carnegiea gigantea]|uniref:Uncharacterized protein n=1 Tax=Carnegiea gigantea TaxID=171969 RepID=A0A9Q1QDC1_9CARY|nr:hypothetical protein Cgig2_027609 [Carnegiea gigantea]